MTLETDRLLGAFRGSVRHWSARQPGADPPAPWRPARPRRRAVLLRWAVAAAVLAVIVAALLWDSARRRRIEADALLWQQIDAQLSRPVPASLEPLMKLVAWEPVPTTGGEAQP